MDKNNTKTFDGKQKSLVRKNRLFATARLISAFVFAIRVEQFLLYMNSKCQAFSHLLWLYSSVCVGLGRKPRRPVFSQRGSNTGSIFFMPPPFVECGRALSVAHVRPCVRACVRACVRPFVRPFVHHLSGYFVSTTPPTILSQSF